MDLEPNEDQLLLRDATRELLSDVLDSAAVRSYLDGAAGAPSARWWQRGADAGWLSLLLPEPYGPGAGLTDLTIVAEEMGRALFPGSLIGATAVGLALCASGRDGQPPPQLAGLLAAVADGSTVVGWCPLPVDDTSSSQRRVALSGVSLIGVARFVADADVASQLLVAAEDAEGTTHVLVDPTAAGVTIKPHIGLDLTRRLFEVTFEAVPVSAIVGERGKGDALAAHLGRVAAVLLAADAVGGCAELVARTVRYTAERFTFGRAIGSYQAIKHKCADMLIWTESARVATYYAAMAVDGLPVEQAARAVSVAKAYAGEAYPRVAGESLQVHGGIGFAWEHDCHLFMRRARVDEMLFGTPRTHKEALAG